MLVSGMFAAFLVPLSDTASDGQTPAGMAGLRHKQRHKQQHNGRRPPVARPGDPPSQGGCGKGQRRKRAEIACERLLPRSRVETRRKPGEPHKPSP